MENHNAPGNTMKRQVLFPVSLLLISIKEPCSVVETTWVNGCNTDNGYIDITFKFHQVPCP